MGKLIIEVLKIVKSCKFTKNSPGAGFVSFRNFSRGLPGEIVTLGTD